jgi:hypothetical protein
MMLMTLRRKASSMHVLGGQEGDDENWEGEFAITLRERAGQGREHHNKREWELAEMNS